MLQNNISLKPYNTFGIDMPAAQYLELHDEGQIYAIAADDERSAAKKIIGGGSNILLTQPVEGLLIRNCLKGIEVVEENAQHTWLQVKAGESWHGLVMHAIRYNLGGLENLSLIPGCVGASPMQNIGAYGVEVKDLIDSVTAWHWADGAFITLDREECRFGYRDSIFKQELKDKVLITSVTFRLDKVHCINTSYGAIREQLDTMGVSEPSIKNVSDAVIAIRRSKLPDPAEIGNAGSFFKNPTISQLQYEELKSHYPLLPSYPASHSMMKIPAGWLIEQCGWKGYRDGDTGVHPRQALVLVNYGDATGDQVFDLSQRIIQSVSDTYGIALEREVNIW